MSSLVSRRRNTPWIHRWSRQIIGAIAILGILNTAYITLTKLAKTAAACPTSGCEQVLESPYATVFGLPLSLFGLLAYLAMAVLALAPLAVKPEQNKPLRTTLEKWTWLPLFVGATAMTVFSGYLMYIMVSQFVSKFGAGGVCYYCVASALFALGMLVVILIGRDWEDIGQLLMVGAIVVMVTLIGTLAIYAPINPQTPRATTSSTSSKAEIELAQHLKKIGAKMYGAYWCPHCQDQKELFGKEAAKIMPYIECASDTANSQTALCQEILPKVEAQTGQKFGFPTWEINGKFYTGTQKLTDLANASGYQGPRNFKNGV
ncbi:MAG: vitamin K epoxide reductase family protein [Leptolyngbyaceae cyanobacterium RU_5_1]|nr:vitamin K epoxide reductase family protein [Leptolyngbyaceae cyanobacterium RU_5_1]